MGIINSERHQHADCCPEAPCWDAPTGDPPQPPRCPLRYPPGAPPVPPKCPSRCPVSVRSHLRAQEGQRCAAPSHRGCGGGAARGAPDHPSVGRGERRGRLHFHSAAVDGAQRGVSGLREAPNPPRAAPEPPDIGSPLPPRDARGTRTRRHGDGRAPHPGAPPGPKSPSPNLQKIGAAPGAPRVPPPHPSPSPNAESPRHPRLHVGDGCPASPPAPHPPPLPDRAAASAECSRAEGRRCACLPARALPPAHSAGRGAPCSPPPPRAPPPSVPRDLHPIPDPKTLGVPLPRAFDTHGGAAQMGNQSHGCSVFIGHGGVTWGGGGRSGTPPTLCPKGGERSG